MQFSISVGFLALAASITRAVVVSGTQGGVDNTTGVRPMRVDINQFKTAGAAWDLYILSLHQFFSTSQSQQLSYYQIAGIHGYPNVPWDGALGNGGGVGYCTHGSVLFPVWHRPYLALFENILWNYAQDIAAQYPSDQLGEYQSAAVSFRIPYWDWSTNSTMPDVVTNPKIFINAPGGSQLIDNPLYNYTFHPLVPSDLPDLPQYPTSVRNPDPNTKQSQEDMANEALNNLASFWHDSTYLLLSSQPNFQGFSNVFGGADESIEDIHGGIHNYVGGPSPTLGHMTLLWYSSMDPIFWLHHANVDRIVAMWQAIYPDSYVVPQASQLESTYFTAIGTVENATYPLAPFYANGNGSFHTALSVRYLKPFGYTYPELKDWTATSGDEYSQQVTSIVNGIYHPNYTSTNNSSLRRRSSKTGPVGAALAAEWEWSMTLNINRTALPQPLTLYFFTAPPPTNSSPSSWAKLPSLIGSGILLRPSSGGNTAFSPPRTTVPLTPDLLFLPCLDPPTVMPWLKQNLYWQAVPSIGANGAAEVPAGAAPDQDGGPIERRKSKKSPPFPLQACVCGSGDITGGAVKLQIKARTVKQTYEKRRFPEYGPWKVYGRGTLTGSGGNAFGVVPSYPP